MNWKRLFLAALVAFIFLQLSDIVIHGMMLEGYYEDLMVRGVFRGEDAMSGYIWVEIIMNAIFSFFFVYIFVKGYEGKGVLEGIRFGLIIGFFWYWVNAYQAFVILPISYGLVWYWIIAGFVQAVIAGILTAAIYKPLES